MLEYIHLRTRKQVDSELCYRMFLQKGGGNINDFNVSYIPL